LLPTLEGSLRVLKRGPKTGQEKKSLFIPEGFLGWEKEQVKGWKRKMRVL